MSYAAQSARRVLEVVFPAGMTVQADACPEPESSAYLPCHVASLLPVEEQTLCEYDPDGGLSRILTVPTTLRNRTSPASSLEDKLCMLSRRAYEDATVSKGAGRNRASFRNVPACARLLQIAAFLCCTDTYGGGTYCLVVVLFSDAFLTMKSAPFLKRKRRASWSTVWRECNYCVLSEAPPKFDTPLGKT